MRETLEEAGSTVAGYLNETEVIIKTEDANGTIYELYRKNNDFAGYVLEIDGIGYEFIRTALIGDLWWAGINTPIQFLNSCL